MIGFSAGTIKVDTWTPPTAIYPVVSALATVASAYPGVAPAEIRLSRTGSVTAELRLYFSLAGSARYGADYQIDGASTAPGYAVIPAGQSFVSLEVKAVGVSQEVRTVILNLTASALHTRYAGTAEINLQPVGTPGAPAPTVALASTDLLAVSGDMTVNFVVSRTGYVDLPLVVNYDLGGTAVRVTDYVQAGTSVMPTSITIGAGASSATKTIQFVGPLIAAKTVVVTLSQLGTYNIAGSSVTLTFTPPDFTLTSITSQTVARVVPGSSIATTQYDSNFDVTTTATTYQDAQLTLNYTGVLPNAISWTSSNPAVATVNASGFVTHLASGSTTITATVQGISRTASLVLVVTGGSTSTIFNSYVPDSLAYSMAQEIDNRLTGKTPSVAKPIFSTRDGSTNTFVRNTGCWAYDIDLTCMSPYSWHGALVSPKHIYSANHASPSGQIKFVTNDNQVITRTIVGTYSPGGDARISVLDSDVPSSIKFAKIMPANFADYTPYLSSRLLPALCTDQEDKALVFETAATAGQNWNFIWPASSLRNSFNEAAVGGDSSSPEFFIINGEAILLTSWWYSNQVGGPTTYGGGTGILFYKNEINAWMAGNSSYQLTPLSLAAFPKYL